MLVQYLETLLSEVGSKFSSTDRRDSETENALINNKTAKRAKRVANAMMKNENAAKQTKNAVNQT